MGNKLKLLVNLVLNQIFHFSEETLFGKYWMLCISILWYLYWGHAMRILTHYIIFAINHDMEEKTKTK